MASRNEDGSLETTVSELAQVTETLGHQLVGGNVRPEELAYIGVVLIMASGALNGYLQDGAEDKAISVNLGGDDAEDTD